MGQKRTLTRRIDLQAQSLARQTVQPHRHSKNKGGRWPLNKRERAIRAMVAESTKA